MLKAVPGYPFAVVATSDGRWSFVSLAGTGGIGVFRDAGSAAVLTQQIQVSGGSGTAQSGQPAGQALTSDGRFLLAADSLSGAAVIDVGRAERGQPGALLGTLGVPAGYHQAGGLRPGFGGAIEVAASPDGRFVFVSLESSQAIAVFNLHRALADGFGAGDFVGVIGVGIAPVGLAVSPDGRWLYATSEVAGSRIAGAGRSNGGTLSVWSAWPRRWKASQR